MIGRHASFFVWALLGAALVAGQLIVVTSRGRGAGLGALVVRITSNPGGRVVLVLGWMFLGWHAFAR
jgi:hypothetical protein